MHSRLLKKTMNNFSQRSSVGSFLPSLIESFGTLKEGMRVTKRIRLTLGFLFVGVSLLVAQPADENFQDDSSDGMLVNTNSRTNDGILYTSNISVNTAIATSAEISRNFFPSGDRHYTFDPLLSALSTTVSIESSDGSAYKLVSLDASVLDGLASSRTEDFTVTGYDVSDVQVASDNIDFQASDAAGSITYTKDAGGAFGTLTFNTDWENIKRITFTGTSSGVGSSNAVSIAFDNLDFSPAVAGNAAPVINNLDATSANTFTEDGSAVILDADVTITDTELDALNSSNGDYDGATITISRNGGANSDDSFSLGASATYILNVTAIEDGGTSIGTFVDDGSGTLTITFDNTSQTPTTADVAGVLQLVQYSNSNNNPPVSVTLDVVVNDGTDTDTESIVVNITAANDAPAIAALDATSANTFTEDGSAVILDGNVTVSDAELDALNGGNGDYDGATITISRNGGADSDDSFSLGASATYILNVTAIEDGGTSIGTFVDDAAGTLTITFDNTSQTPETADIAGVLQLVQYSNANNNPPTSVTLDVTVNDGAGANNTVTESIVVNITAANDAPVIAALDATSANTFTEDGSAVILDGDVTVSDPELDALNGGNGDYDGATITISRNGGANSNDSFTLGSSATYILNVTAIEDGGTSIGTFVDDGSGTLTITFDNTSQTPETADIAGVLQLVQYANANNTPPASVTLDVVVNDGEASNNTDTESIVVNITPANDAPVVTNSGGTTSFTEGDGLTTIDVSISVTDADHTTLPASATATVSITGGFQDTEDVLAFTNSNATLFGDAAASYNSSTGVLSITTSGATTVTQLQDVLRATQYNNTSNDPNTTARTITFQVNDGTDPSNSDTKTVNVFDLNTAPTFTVTAVTPLNYSVGLGAVALWQSATGAADVIESGQEIVAVSIEVTNATDGSAAGDAEALNVDGTDITLENSNSGSISAGTVTTASGETITYNVSRSGNDATVALTGFSLTEAEFEDLIEAITYENSDGTPTVATRTVTINFLKDSGLHDGTFDIGESDPNQISTVTFLNPPVINNLDATSANTFSEGGSAVILDADVTVTDVELDALNSSNGDYDGATITISRNGGADSDDSFSLGASATYILNVTAIEDGGTSIGTFVDDAAGTLTITFDNTSQTPETADVAGVLQLVQYENSSVNPPASVTLDVVVSDGSATDTESIVVNITPVNDPPVINNLDATSANTFTEDGSAIILDADVTVTDPELDGLNGGSGDYDGATITISRNGGANSDDSFSLGASATYILNVTAIEDGGTSIGTFVDDGSGTLTITFDNTSQTPTTADVAGVLQLVQYSNSNNNPPVSVTLDVVVDDGEASNNTDTESIVVNITAANDAPAIAALDATSANTFTEDGSAVILDGNVTVSDAELDALNGGNGDYDGATITISRNGGADSDDSFSLGASATYILNVTAIEDGGTSIGTFVDDAAGTLTITFDNTSQTPETADIAGVLQLVQYSNANNNPPTSVTLDVTVNDGAGANNTVTESIVVNITAANDAPVIAALDATSANTFTEDGSAVILDGDVTVSDPELDALNGGNGDYDGATITISRNGGANSNDSFTLGSSATYILNVTAIEDGGTSIGTFVDDGSGTLTITFDNTSQTPETADIAGVLQLVQYANANNTPPASVTLDVVVNDGEASNNTDTESIVVNITPANDAPVVTNSGGTTSFTEGDGLTTIDVSISVTDADHTTLPASATATVSITGGFQDTEDVLAFTNSNATLFGDAAASYNSSTGVLSITTSGATTVTQLQDVLRATQYNNTSNDPNTTARTITFQVNDGTDPSNSDTKTVNVFDLNTAPTFTVTAVSPLDYSEGLGAVALWQSATGAADVIESGQEIVAVSIEVTNATDGSAAGDAEALNVDGTDITLENSNSGSISAGTVTTASGETITYNVSRSGNDATVALTGFSLTEAEFEDLIEAITYENTDATPTIANRVVTINFLKDSGLHDGTFDIGESDPNQTSTVTFIAKDTDSSIANLGGETDDIDYTSFTGTSGSLTTSNTVSVLRFSVTDAATADPLGTTITDLALDITSGTVGNIKALGVYDETAMSFIFETGTITASNSISLATDIEVASGGTENYTIYVSFENTIVDNDQYIFDLTGVTTATSGSSGVTFSGTTSASAGRENTVVVGGTALVITSEPSGGTAIAANFSIIAQVEDANGNVDTDFAEQADITIHSGPGGAAFDGAGSTTNLNPSSGVFTFSNLSVNNGGDYEFDIDTDGSDNSMTIAGFTYATPLTVRSSVISASDAVSDVIENAAFDYPEYVEYLNYQDGDGVIDGDATEIVLGRFDIRDGGESGDSDTKVTRLQDFEVTVSSGANNLDRVALFTVTATDNGDIAAGTKVGEFDVSTASNVLTFDLDKATLNGTFGINEDFDVPDNGTVTVELRASFNSSTSDITDQDQITFTVTSTTADTGGGRSGFGSSDGTPVSGPSNGITPATTVKQTGDNLVEVVGDRIVVTNDAAVLAGSPYERDTDNIAITLEAQDVNGNLDLDEGSDLAITGPTDFDGSSTTTEVVTLTNGVVTTSFTVFSEEAGVVFSIADNDANTGSRTGATTLSTGDATSAVNVEDTTAPDIDDVSMDLSPFDTESNVALTGPLTMTFDEDVAVGTGDISIVLDVFPPEVITLDVTDNTQVSVTGNVATLTLPSLLKGSGSYYVIVDAGAFNDSPNNTDAVGAAELDFAGFTTDTDWTFSTMADGTPPALTITRNDPATGTSDATNSNTVEFSLEFSEEIDPATFTEQDIAITLTGTTIGTDGTSQTADLYVVNGNDTELTNSGDDINFTFTINNIDGDGTIGIEVGPNIEDASAADNIMAASVTSSDFTIDNSASGFDAITITSDFSDNTLANTGNVITLVMDFDEDQGEAPTVDFASGGDVVNAGTITATETNAGTFEWTATYTVDALDTDGIITYDINFTDLAENAGATDQTNGAVSGSVTVDRGAPVIERLEISSDNATNNQFGITGNTVTIEVEFDEDVVPGFTNVESGGAVFADPGPTIMEIDAVNDIWQFTYVVDAGDTDGNVTFDLNFNDAAGNAGTAASETDITDASSMTIDNTTPNAPTVTIASDNGTDNLHATTGDVVTITLDFDEDMSAVSVDALQSGGVNTANAAIVTETDAAQDIWTATYTVDAGDTEGDVTFSISFDDAAGNPEGAAITEADLAGSSVEVDLTAPTLQALSIASNNGTDASHAITGNTVTLTMDFDDDLSANPVVSFTSNGGAVNNAVTVMETDAVNDIWTATYTVSALDNDGQVNFTLNFNDDAGLAGTTADNTDLDGGGASQTVEIDNTGPAIEAMTISSDNGTNNQYGITGNTVTIQVDFDDDLSATPVFSNVQSGGVAINDASPSITETNAVNDIWEFTYVVNAGDTDGALTFDLDFTDDAGTAGTTASETDVTNGSSMTVDNLQPTVVVTDDHQDPDDANDDTFKQGDIVTITADFTEANGLNGTPTIVIGTSVSSTGMSATADALVWTFDWTVPAGDDASEVVVISATDVAGNAIGTQTNTNAGDYEIDNTAPNAGATVHIESNNAVSTAGASVGDDVILSFTASETLAGDPTVVFQSDNANVQNAPGYTNTAGNDWEARYEVDAADQSGAISFTLDFTDVAGNAATQVTATGDASSVTVDSNVPSINSITITPTLGSTSNTGDNTAVFTIDFSEGVGNFTVADDIVINQTGLTLSTPTLNPGAGNTWILDFGAAGVVGNGTLSIDVLNNGATPIIDASGNTLPGAAGVEASSVTVTFDQTVPALSPVSLSTNNATDNQHATAGDIVTLSFTSDDALSTTPTVSMAINGTAVVGTVTVNDLGSNMYTATYAIDGTGTVVGTDIDDQGALTFTIDFTDDAGNAGTQVTGTTDATSVEVDFTVPTLTTVTLISDNGTNNQHATGGNTILLDIVSSDVLSALPDVVLRSGGLSVVGSVTVAHDNPGAPDFQNFNVTYTVDGTGSTGGVDKDADGSLTFFIDFEDDAGNAGTQVTSTTNASVMEVDVTAPTLSNVTLVSSQTASEDFEDASHGTTGNLVTLSFMVDDDLSAAPNIGLSVGGTGVTATVNGASAPTYTATYTLLGTENNGAVTFTIDFTDDAGNAGTQVTATTDASSIEADFIAPTLTSVSLSTDNSTDNQHATTGDEITLSFTSDDDLSATPDVDFSIGGTMVSPTVNDLGSNNYSATYTLLGSENEGAVTFTIDFVDDAGIAGTQVTATTDATSVEADFNAPTLTTVSIASSQTASETFVNASHAADGNTVTIDIVSSDVLSAIPTVTVRSGNIDVQGPVTVAHDNPGAPDFQNFNVTYAVDGVGTSDGVDRDADGTVTFFINFVDDAGIAGTQVTATTDASTVEVDNTAPTLSPVTVTTNNGTNNQRATAGDIITFSFTSDDDLSATPVVNMSINGTAVVGSISVNTGSAPVYTATYTVDGTGSVVGTDIDDQGTLTFSIAFTDDAGNAGTPVTATTNSSAVDVDFTAPTLTSVSLSTDNGTDNQHATTGDEITLSFTSDDALSATPSVTMLVGVTNVSSSVTVNDLGSNNYSATYTLIGSESEGAVTFTIDFVDDAGNSGTQVTATTDATSVEADFNAPTLTTVSIASSQTASETFVNASHAADGNTVTIDIVSSDVLSALPTVTVRSGNIDVQGPVTVAHDNPGAPDFQNFNVTYAVDGVGTSDGVDKDADGTVTFFINFVDDAGIAGTQVTATTDASTVEVDNTAPTLSSVTLVSSQTASEDFADASHGTTGNLVTLSFTADDDLSATPVVGLSIGGTAVTATVNTGSAPNYTATYTLAGTENNGAVTFTIDFTDDAGNDGTQVTATSDASSIEADFIAPTLSTVSLSTNNGTDNQHATTGDEITLSFTMDDDLSSSAASNPAVTMSIGGTGVTPTVNDLGSNNYSATYTLLGSENEGAVTFTIDFIDDAGISGTQVTATTDATSVEADFNAPTLTTVSIASSQTASETFVNASHAADGNTVTIDIVSSDVLSAIPTVTVRSGNIDVQGPVTVAHDNPGAPDFQNFNVTYAVDGVGTTDGVDKDADGTVTFFINFVDDAGIAGTQVTATTDASTVEVDNTAPTLSPVTVTTNNGTNNQRATAGDVITFSFTSDDDLSTTPVVNMSINGTAVVGSISVNTGSAPVYTATYTVDGTGSVVGTDIDDQGTLTFSIAFTDDAGNAGTPVTATTNSSAVDVDFTAPTLTSVSLSTDNGTDNQHATTGDEITLSFTSDDALSATPSVTMLVGVTNVSSSVTVNDLGSNNYSATYTLIGSESEGAVTFTIDFVDDAGNSGTQVTATTDATSVEADFNAPTLTTVSIASSQTASETFVNASHAADGNTVTIDIVSSDVLSALPTVTVRSGNIDVQGPVTVAHDNPGAPDFQNFNVTYAVDGVGTSDGVDKDADGTVTFFINFVDDAGIAGTQVTATTDASTVEVDNTAPTLSSVTLVSSQTASEDFADASHGTTGNLVTLSFTADDDLSATPVVGLSIGGTAVTATVNTGSAPNYTATYTLAGTENNGAVTFTIDFTDDAGNDGTQVTATSDASSIEADFIAPTLSTVSLSTNNGTDNQHATTGDEITLSFTMDDDLSSSAASNPAVTMSIGGTGVTPTVNDLGSNNYSATYTLLGSENEGAVTFTIDFIDDAGISGTQVTATTDATSVEADFNAPTLTTVTLISNNTTDNQHATDGDVVTLDIVSSDVLSAIPTITVRSGNIDVQGPVTVAHDNPGAPDFINFNMTYTVDGVGTSDGVDKDADGALTFFINFVDDAGIAGTQVTATTDASSIEVDASDPVIESLSIVRTSGTDNTAGDDDFVQDGDEVTITVDFNDDLAGGFPTISNLQSGGVAMAESGAEVITETDATNEVWTIVFNVDAGDTDGNISFQIDYNDDAGNTGVQVTEADITDGSSATVDNTAPTATITAEIGSSNTQIIVTFSENVATNGTNPTDFTVVDEDSNNFAVSAQADGTAEDDEIVLTVADFSAAEGDLLVTYTNNNSEIFDLANNDAPTTAAATIERTFTGEVSLTEVATGTGGDTDADVALYRTTSDGVDIFAGTPVTFTPSVEGSTITIYRDEALTDPVTGAQQTMVTKATGWTPTIDVFLADEGLTLGGTSSADYDADANDINGVYTFYITETAVNETDSEGSAVVYSLAFLDDIDNTNDRINFSVGENATTDLRVGNALNQELQISGVAIGTPTTAAGTSFVNSEATNITSATFNASIVGQGTYPLDFEWINATSDVSARFEDVVTLSITPVVSPFFEDGQKINFSRAEAQQDLLINENPSGVDVATETDGGDADFYDLEIYYVQNDAIVTSIGVAGVNSSAGGEISSALIYSGTAQTFGSPSGAASTDWDIDPSAIDAFLDANVTSGRSAIDTLIIAYITANDNATSSTDLTVNTTTNLYLFEPVDDIVTQETDFSTEYFTCEGDAIAAIATSNVGESATYIWYADDGDLTFDDGDTEITRSTTLTNANILNETTTYTAIDGTGQTTQTYTNDSGVNGTAGTYYFWVHHVRGATDEFLGTTSDATLISVTVFEDPDEPIFDSNTAVTANNTDAVDFTLFYDAADLTESVTFTASSSYSGADFSTSSSTSDLAAADTIQNEFRWYTSNEDGTRGTQITSGGTVTAQQLQLTGLTADADRYIYLEEVTNIVNAADDTELYEGCTSNGVVILFSVKVQPDAPTGTTSFFYCEGETVADLTMNGEAGNTFRWLDVNNNLIFEQTTNTDGAFTAGIASDLGIGSTPVDSLYTIKVFQVSDIVSTSTNSSSIAPDSVNIPFAGAISDTTVITIDVKEVPAAPVLDTPVNGVEYCDDVSTQLSIGFTDDGNADLFRIYQGDGVTRDDDLSATQSAILFDLSEEDYLAGLDSTIFISQVSFSGEGGADFSGCESPLAQVDVHPNPQFTSFANGSSLINIVEACEVGITAEISIDNLNTLTEENFTVDWSIDDELRSESNNFSIEVDQVYNAGSSISLDISVENQTTMCSADISETRIIGVTPIADFTINNITENNNTALVVRDNNPDVTNTLVESISMTITDDSGNTVFEEERAGGENSGILNSAFNNDFAAGSYTATMFTISTSGCTDDEVLDFNILPQVTISVDTLIDFDRGNLESWFAEEDRNVSGELDDQNVRQLVGNSWDLDTPAGIQIFEDPDRNPESIMWITNRTGEYNAREVSYVYSPSFDIQIERPAVSFDYYLDLANNDGVVLQYSTNDGDTWNTLGEPSTGIGWYNEAGVPSNPGGVEGNPQRFAWSGDGGANWLSATHAVSGDDLTTIRFRFALGSRDAEKDGSEGFAFDNFRVFSRDRTTLLETFTSTQIWDDVDSTNAMKSTVYVKENFPGDIVVINYFTNLGDDEDNNRIDPIYDQNSSDPNARLAFYGINEIETGVLGGIEIGTNFEPAQGEPDIDANTGNLGFVEGDYSQDLLKPTSVRMNLGATLRDNENTVDISLTVRTDFPEGLNPFDAESQISTRVMVLQESVGGEGVIENVPGDVVFQNVLREVITGSSGLTNQGIIENDTEFVDFTSSWEVSGIFANQEVDSVTMIVVAFVQDEISREILQVVEQTVRVAVPETVTSIHPDFFSSRESYDIYPNPAENVFTVELEKPTMMDLNWVLIDQSGKKVVVGDIQRGNQTVEVITDHLSSGLYFFQLYNNDHVWDSQRVMIMKGSR